ncbi:hypothetical protein PIROE2DRAFT_59155 [Piromyces sp. E2]|nr:hypothetical protein PIROE2DRAFT_59155 [Piromyces sp. E2]|eukprot:OUM66807.1 hypothetical protein PIROE2DRAFT_59155 [Piromyces sp. E2]
MTDVISPFNENSQKLTNLAYAITIPVPSNMNNENQSNIPPPFMKKTPKPHMPKSFHNNARSFHGGHPINNNYRPVPMNSPPRDGYNYPIRPPPFDMDIDGPMGGPMHSMNGPYPMDMDVDDGYIDDGFPPPFHEPFPVNNFRVPNCNTNNKIFNNKNHLKKNRTLTNSENIKKVNSSTKSLSNKSNGKSNNNTLIGTVTSNNNSSNNTDNNKSKKNDTISTEVTNNNKNKDKTSNDNGKNKNNNANKNKDKTSSDNGKNNNNNENKNKDKISSGNGKNINSNANKNNIIGKSKSKENKNVNDQSGKKDVGKVKIKVEEPDKNTITTKKSKEKLVEKKDKSKSKEKVKKEDGKSKSKSKSKSKDKSKSKEDKDKSKQNKENNGEDKAKNKVKNKSSKEHKHKNDKKEKSDIKEKKDKHQKSKHSSNDNKIQKIDDKKKKVDETNIKDKTSTKENNTNGKSDKEQIIIDVDKVDKYPKRSIEHINDSKSETQLTKKQKKDNSREKDFFDKTNRGSSKGSSLHNFIKPKPIDNNNNNNNNSNNEKKMNEVVSEIQKGKVFSLSTINKNSKGPDFKITKVNPLLLDSGNVKNNGSVKLISVQSKLPDINNSYDINNSKNRNNDNKFTENKENINEILSHNSDYSLSVLTTDLYSTNNPAIIRQMAFDDVVNYKNINYIGDVEYNRSINHNLIYSQHSNVLLSNINNQQYYIWNLNDSRFPIYSYNENDSIHDLKEPSLKLQYNGILRDSITLSESFIFGLDFEGNLAKWDLDSLSTINDVDKMDICSVNPQSVIKFNNDEKIKKIKTYSNSNKDQEKLIALTTDNNIILYDLKNDDFKPVNKILNAHDSEITTVDINSINSYYVLTGGDDDYIKLWDLRNPNVELHSSCYYSNGISKLRWCPHLGNVFCCSSKNGIISIWSLNSLMENKPLMINTEHQVNSPVKVDFEWNPYYDQEGTIASIDKPSASSKDSCIQVWRPLIYTYLSNGLIK